MNMLTEILTTIGTQASKQTNAEKHLPAAHKQNRPEARFECSERARGSVCEREKEKKKNKKSKHQVDSVFFIPVRDKQQH